MRDTVKTVKIPTPKITFSPKNEDEEKHLKVLESLLSHKRRGDWKLVAELTGIPVTSAEKAFFRVYQKHHFEVVNALQKVIENRNELLKQ